MKPVRAAHGCSIKYARVSVLHKFGKQEQRSWLHGQAGRVKNWKSDTKHKAWKQRLETELGIMKPEDWYNVTKEEFQSKAGPVLRNVFGGSFTTALHALYPEVSWQMWRFKQVPPGYWDDLNNQRKYFDWIGEQMGLKSMEDWYQVKTSTLKKYAGSFLLDNHNGSLTTALQVIYPEYPWLLWKFRIPPMKFWHNKENQRKFVDWLAEQLNIRSALDWYKVKPSEVIKRGGKGLLFVHGGSLKRALAAVYQDKHIWKYGTVPARFWRDDNNLRSYIEWLAEQLNITNKEEWYGVSHQDIKAVWRGASPLRDGGICTMLKRAYPDYHWDDSKFNGSKKSQLSLFHTVQSLFPNTEVHLDFKNADMRFENGYKMELDIFVPSISLALEYQGFQHYEDSAFMNSHATLSITDPLKLKVVNTLGITLISIPHWWNRKKESVAATIHRHRPDLLAEYASFEPIPETPPLSESHALSSGVMIDAHPWNAWIN